MKRIISIFLQILGALSAIAIVIFVILTYGPSSTEDYEVTNTIKSPSGGHYASIYTRMGGGAAGWCRKGVLVHPIESAPKSEADLITRWSVIDGRCSEEFSIKWKNNEELDIVSSGTKVPDGISIRVSK